MNARLRCIAPAPSIGNWRASSANWREPASSQDRGEAYRGSRCRSITEPPISTARPRERARRDRRNARMDVVGATRAFDIRDVAAGAQTLTYGATQPSRRERLFLVESECDADGFRSPLSVAAPFVWRCLTRSPVAPVSTPRSSNRTCRFAASGSRTRRHAFTHDGPRPSWVSRTSRKCP